MNSNHKSEIKELHKQNDELTDFMIADCEKQLNEYGDSFWDGPDDFKAISLATHGEKASTEEVKEVKKAEPIEEEEPKQQEEPQQTDRAVNKVVIVIFSLLSITVVGLIWLVRDL